MNTGAAPCDEFPDWSIRRCRLHQLDQNVPGTDRLYASAVRISDRRLIQTEHIAEKRHLVRYRVQRDPNV
jgi:hypothetical protein